jgi:hypothetical protein
MGRSQRCGSWCKARHCHCHHCSGSFACGNGHTRGSVSANGSSLAIIRKRGERGEGRDTHSNRYSLALDAFFRRLAVALARVFHAVARTAVDCSATALVVGWTKRRSPLARVTRREAVGASLVGHAVRMREDGSMASTTAMLFAIRDVVEVWVRVMHCGGREQSCVLVWRVCLKKRWSASGEASMRQNAEEKARAR